MKHVFSFSLLAALVWAVSANACSSDEPVQIAADAFFAPADGTSPLISVNLQAGKRGYLHLGRRNAGDRWEIEDRPMHETLMWRLDPEDIQTKDMRPVRLWLLGSNEGIDSFPARFVPQNGAPVEVHVMVTIIPPTKASPANLWAPVPKC